MSPYLSAEIWKRTRVHRINIAARDSCDVPTNGNPRAGCGGKFLDSAQPSIFRPSVAAESARISLWFRLCRFSTAMPLASPFFVYLSRSIDTFLLSPLNFPDAETKERVRGKFLPKVASLSSFLPVVFRRWRRREGEGQTTYVFVCVLPMRDR